MGAGELLTDGTGGAHKDWLAVHAAELVPTGMAEIGKTMVAKLFDDMSKASENANVAMQGLKEAAASEQAAGGRSVDAYKAALEHYQKTSAMMLEAAEKPLPIVAPELTAAGALSGAAGSGSGTDGGTGGSAGSGTGGSGGDGRSPGLKTGLSGTNISETGGLLNIAREARQRGAGGAPDVP